MSSQVTSWKRLEPRYRLLDVRPGLARPLADPAWMLLRQWQVGEFEGIDGGSPLIFEVDATTTMISRFRKGRHPGGVQSSFLFDPLQGPLDPLVEQEPGHAGRRGALSPLLMVYAAERFFTQLMEALVASSASQAMWRSYLLNELGLACVDWSEPDDDRHNHALSTLIARGTLLDGQKLYTLVVEELAPSGGTYLAPNSPLVRTSPEYEGVNATVLAWRDWVDGLVRVDETRDESSCWEQDTLSYQFSVSGRDAQSKEYALAGTSRGEALDWYSFDRHAEGVSLSPKSKSTSTTLRRLMAPVRFPGTEAPRFWTMDDGNTALAAVDATTTQLPRALWMEFVLTMGQSWSIVPLEFFVGSINVLKTARMITTFDRDVPLPILGQEPGLFRVFVLDGANDTQGDDILVYLPPVATRRQESMPVETLHLMRDEAQNVAWAIESTVEGSAGRPRQRHEAWQKRRETSEAAKRLTVEEETLVYELSNRVPDFWYPMLPQVTRNANGLITQVRLEQGRLLTRSLLDHPPEGTLFEQGFSLPDESVPSKGRLIHRRDRNARWSNGRVELWRGRQRMDRAPVTDSGLIFDQLNWTVPESERQQITKGSASDLAGAYPWSIFERFDHVKGTTSKAARGGSGQLVGKHELWEASLTAQSAHTLSLFGTGRVDYPDAPLHYIHRFGVFSIMVVATLNSGGSGTTWLFGTTYASDLPGVALIYEEAQARLKFRWSDGTSWYDVAQVYQPFGTRGPTPIVVTGDGAQVRIHIFDELKAMDTINPQWKSQEEAGVASWGSANRLDSSNWQGLLGVYGVMPKALTNDEVSELVDRLRLETAWPSAGLMHVDATNPRMLQRPDGAHPDVDEEVTKIMPHGTCGLALDKLTGTSSADGVLRVSLGLGFDPSAASAQHGFAGSLDEPLQLSESTWLLSWNQQSSGGTILGAPSMVGGDPALGVEFGVNASGTVLLVTERGFTQSVELGTLGPLYLVCVRFTAQGNMEIWTGVRPQPDVTLKRPGFHFEGTWNSTNGELRLHQKDDVVWGDYNDGGIIKGRIDPATGDLEGIFTNGSSQGRLRFTLKGGRLEGLWAFGAAEPVSSWDADLVSLKRPVLTHWAPQTITRAPSFQGTWNSSYGELRLLQKDDVVWGDYKSVGIIAGRVDASTGVFEGIFTNNSSQGRVRFELSTEGTFEGTWTYSATGPLTGNWDGLARTSSAAPTLTQWLSSAPSFEGTWNTTWGVLRLKQAGTRVWGDYKNVGVIEGEVDLATGGVLEGTYTNGGTQGRIRFTLSGDTFDGLWAQGTTNPYMNWDGTRTARAVPTLLTWPAYGFTLTAEPFEGTWLSTRGELLLKQAGTRVWGDIVDQGTMEGVVDLDTNILEGTYTYGGESGKMRFVMNDDHIEGLYGVGDHNPSLNWDANQTSEDTPELMLWPSYDVALSRIQVSEIVLGTSRRVGENSWGGNLGSVWIWDKALDLGEVYDALRYVHEQWCGLF